MKIYSITCFTKLVWLTTDPSNSGRNDLPPRHYESIQYINTLQMSQGHVTQMAPGREGFVRLIVDATVLDPAITVIFVTLVHALDREVITVLHT